MTPTEYKNKIASRYVSVDPSQIVLKIIESDYYLCSHKLDGHLGILSIEKETIKLFDRSGDELNIPSILNAAKAIKHNGLFAGEICVFKDGKPGANFEVTAALADPDSNDIRFGIFDMINDETVTTSQDLRVKFDFLKNIAVNGDIIFAIGQSIFDSRKDILSFFNQSVTDYEGIVVRSSNGIVYKVKPIRTFDLAVIGYSEGIGERKGMIRDLMLGCVIEENKYMLVSQCGNGFTDVQRKDLFEQLKPMSVESDYLEISGAKTAFVMVNPELVVEISCLDLISETTSGIIKKATLTYDSTKGYRREGAKPSVSLISPVYLRLRSDKKPVLADTGIKQIEQFIIKADGTSEELMSPSEIMGREIYTKSAKGNTAIRKFSVLKTNKEHTGDFSPFVVVYTDFSGGRKTPMEQEIYLCETEKDATDKVALLKEENIKKGWIQFNQ